MKWMIPYERLGSDQTEVIEELLKGQNEPIWIQGHAGSGKSVLLVHALKDFLVKQPDAKVCIVVYTRALVELFENGIKQVPELDRFQIPVLTIYDQSLRGGHYDAIFADECQDFPQLIIDRLKGASKRLIIAGDVAQSIYSGSLIPGFNQYPASAEAIEDAIKPKIRKLRTIYRLTKSVIDIVKNVFPDMLESLPHAEKEDVDIGFYKSSTTEQEIEFCWKEIKEGLLNRPDEVSAALFVDYRPLTEFVNGILKLESKAEFNFAVGRPNYQELNNYLADQNIPIMYVGNGIGSLETADVEGKLVLMTYYSSKGLDFDYVYLPLVSDRFGINGPMRAILLVGLTRSKKGLMVTFTDNLHPGFQEYFRTLIPKNIPSSNRQYGMMTFD